MSHITTCTECGRLYEEFSEESSNAPERICATCWCRREGVDPPRLKTRDEKMQNSLMRFDPATGEPNPYPSHAQQWRDYHGHMTAWLFNPWTGKRRDARDVGSDVKGLLIMDKTEQNRREDERRA